MTSLLPILRKIAEAPTFVSGMTLFALMVMTFCDVVMRSAFNAPIEAASDLTLIFMAVIVFTVLPVVSGRGEHIAVDLLDGFFGPMAGRLRDGLISLICGVCLYWPAERCMVLAERARSYGDLTEFLNIPQFYPAWLVAICTALTAVALVVRGVVILIWGLPAEKADM